MSDTNNGMSSCSGWSAFGPITTSVPTSTSSSWGVRASWAVTNWMSSQLGSSWRGTPIEVTGPWCPRYSKPSFASRRISPTWGSLRGAVRILVRALVRVTIVRLRMVLRPGSDLLGVDQEVAAVHPRRELVEPLGVVVARDPGVIPVVPTVQPADEVVAVDVAVDHQRTSVQAPAVEHRVVVVETERPPGRRPRRAHRRFAGREPRPTSRS